MTAAEHGAVIDTICVIAEWIAPEGQLDQTRELACQLAAASIQEPGCILFDVWEPIDGAGHLILIEEYAGEVGRKAHRESIHFTELVLNRAVPMGVDRVIRMYTRLAVV